MLRNPYPALSLMGAKLKSWMSFRSRAYGPFPMEIWTEVIAHLPDHDLLASSGVCQAFNVMCWKAHLHHNGVSNSCIAEGTIDIRSHSLTALRRSLYPPPIGRLSCTFDNPERTHGSELPDPSGTREVYATLLSDIMYSFIPNPAGGPPCLVHLDSLMVAEPLMKRRISVGHIKSLKYRRLSSGPIVIINLNDIGDLILGAAFAHEYSPSGGWLTHILPHITLPFLYSLDIQTAAIDPQVLSNFLTRHPNLISVSYRPRETDIPIPRVLINPPVSLPNLQTIGSNMHPLPLMDGVAPSAPTQVNVRCYPQGSELGNNTGMKSALQRIAERETDTAPKIDIWDWGLETPFDGELETEWGIVNTLENVHVVRVNAQMVSNARAILPWLALFLALTLVTFEHMCAILEDGDPIAIAEAFKAKAITVFNALPSRPNVVWL
ncbi:hypothetical protein C8R44DRAFT_747661 [Mycena epipterygia]|nr:hypothetical protein C8R44DRAFT_747661 [Mycena epipterygia]